jgi:hypothetical protein
MTSTTRAWQRLRRPLHREEGQAAFEFLLALPLFFTFFLLLIDFGVMMYGYVSIANSAREGARYGAVNCGAVACTPALIQDRAVERSGGFLSSTGDVTVSWPSGTSRGSPIVVSISHVHDFVFFPFSQTIESCAEMRIEQSEPTATSGGSGC